LHPPQKLQRNEIFPVCVLMLTTFHHPKQIFLVGELSSKEKKRRLQGCKCSFFSHKKACLAQSLFGLG
jgi:hypothetical protein